MNCIQYTVCDTLGFSIDNAIASNAHGTECTNDFIVISGSGGTCDSVTLNSRYCGIYLGLSNADGDLAQGPVCG